MKEVTMEYEVSLLNAGDAIQALQNGMSMVLNHDNKNIQRITGYAKCLRNMRLLNEKISSVEPDVILVDKDAIIRALVEYIKNPDDE